MSPASQAQEAFDRVADASVFEMCDRHCRRRKKRYAAQADAAKSLSGTGGYD